MKQPVEDLLAFNRLLAALEREEICCGTVSPAQCFVLQTLTEGAWDVSGLAGQARVTKGAMTRLVDGLAKRGWVRRTRDAGDARRVLISLTAAGKEEARRLRCLTQQELGAILDAIPAGERPQVLRSIRLLAEAARQVQRRADCC